MADLGSIEDEIKSLPTAEQPTFLRIFRGFMRDWRFGHPTGSQPDPSTNFGGGFFHGVTPSNAGDEFTIPHGFGRVPYLAIPVLRLDAVGSAIVPVVVSRAADDKRLYFTSTEENVPVSFYVEG